MTIKLSSTSVANIDIVSGLLGQECELTSVNLTVAFIFRAISFYFCYDLIRLFYDIKL